MGQFAWYFTIKGYFSGFFQVGKMQTVSFSKLREAKIYRHFTWKARKSTEKPQTLLLSKISGGEGRNRFQEDSFLLLPYGKTPAPCSELAYFEHSSPGLAVLSMPEIDNDWWLKWWFYRLYDPISLLDFGKMKTFIYVLWTWTAC